MRTTLLAVVLLLFGSFVTPGTRAKEIVAIKVRGYYFAAPATIPITIAVEPGVNNRALIVEADSDDYYRSSMIELDGEREKRLHTVEFKSLPAGDYLLRAQVRSKTDVLGTAVNELVVTGMTQER